MNVQEIITLVTIVVTWILGILAKKSKFINTNLIPLQNLAIGLIVAIIEYIIVKDFSVAIAVSGLLAGSTYDIVHNLMKLKKGE